MIGDFVPYGRTARYRDATMSVTEKIDGTNGLIVVGGPGGRYVSAIGSRKREISPDSDNFGFAAWVMEHEEALCLFLGEGYHYGEWAGDGIQKNPLDLRGKHFFLFAWHKHPPEKFAASLDVPDNLHTVPVVHESIAFDDTRIDDALQLVTEHSLVPGALTGRAGEGIVISAFGTKLKYTPDNRPKGQRE